MCPVPVTGTSSAVRGGGGGGGGLLECIHCQSFFSLNSPSITLSSVL